MRWFGYSSGKYHLWGGGKGGGRYILLAVGLPLSIVRVATNSLCSLSLMDTTALFFFSAVLLSCVSVLVGFSFFVSFVVVRYCKRFSIVLAWWLFIVLFYTLIYRRNSTLFFFFAEFSSGFILFLRWFYWGFMA